MHILRNTTRPEPQRRGGDSRGRNSNDRRHSPPPSHTLAPAIRVKNLKLLRDELGEDNLAVLLGISIQRTKELLDGVNFTSETTFHIENTLELPSGFLDQVNPKLTEEERTRLKTAHLDDRRDESPAAGSATSAPSTEISTDDKELPMATATKTPAKKSAQRAPSEEDLREIRRLNFGLLTDRPMAKKKLAELTGLSPANISHRIHGNKIFDAAEGEFFAEKLGLPKDWFESKHEEADIPPKVLEILTVPGAPPTRKAAAKKAPGEAGAARAGRRGRRPAAAAGSIPQGTAPTKGSTPGAAAPAASAGAGRAPSPAPAPAARGSAPVTARTAMQAASGSAAEDAILSAGGGGLGPIATALLHTLAAKARSGSLSEDQALKLLNEAAVL